MECVRINEERSTLFLKRDVSNYHCGGASQFSNPKQSAALCHLVLKHAKLLAKIAGEILEKECDEKQRDKLFHQRNYYQKEAREANEEEKTLLKDILVWRD